MITSADLKSDDDIVYPTILANKVDIDSRYGQSTAPFRNGMQLTSNEYREFISSISFFQAYLKKFLNGVYFSKGIHMPYNPQELYT